MSHDEEVKKMEPSIHLGVDSLNIAYLNPKAKPNVGARDPSSNTWASSLVPRRPASAATQSGTYWLP